MFICITDCCRAERTDRFKSERFAEDRTALTMSSRRNDREFRGNRMGRSGAPRDGRRQGGYRERRYDTERRYDAEDYDMSKVTERFSNPTYVPKDSRYFLVSSNSEIWLTNFAWHPA